MTASPPFAAHISSTDSDKKENKKHGEEFKLEFKNVWGNEILGSGECSANNPILSELFLHQNV